MNRIDWSKRADYMRERHGVEPNWADEAVNDELAVWLDPDPKSHSGRSVRVIGYSVTRQRILVVILVRDPQLLDADFWGANGWHADGADRRMYETNER